MGSQPVVVSVPSGRTALHVLIGINWSIISWSLHLIVYASPTTAALLRLKSSSADSGPEGIEVHI